MTRDSSFDMVKIYKSRNTDTIRVMSLAFRPASGAAVPTRYRTRHFFNSSNTNKILQRNWNSSTFVVRETKRDVCAVRFEFRYDILISGKIINPLTPNDLYSGRTAPLTSKRCILYIYSTNIVTEYFKHGIYSLFFFKMQFVS